MAVIGERYGVLDQIKPPSTPLYRAT